MQYIPGADSPPFFLLVLPCLPPPHIHFSISLQKRTDFPGLSTKLRTNCSRTWCKPSYEGCMRQLSRKKMFLSVDKRVRDTPSLVGVSQNPHTKQPQQKHTHTHISYTDPRRLHDCFFSLCECL